MSILLMSIPNTYYSKEDLRNLLRLLWIEKNMWTRFYIVSKFAGLDDTVYLSNRIYESAIAISNVFQIYYGASTKRIIEDYLRQDISYNLSYIDSLKTEEKELTKDIVSKWKENAMDFASYLSTINKSFDKDHISSMLINLIDLNIHEAETRLSKDYITDIGQFDLISYLSNSFADYLWLAIINQLYPIVS